MVEPWDGEGQQQPPWHALWWTESGRAARERGEGKIPLLAGPRGTQLPNTRQRVQWGTKASCGQRIGGQSLEQRSPGEPARRAPRGRQDRPPSRVRVRRGRGGACARRTGGQLGTRSPPVGPRHHQEAPGPSRNSPSPSNFASGSGRREPASPSSQT